MIDKIRKLLALARNNPNSAEAEVALARAMRMMAEHGIREEDVQEETQIGIYQKLIKDSDGIQYLGSAAALLMGTVFVEIKGRGWAFAGRPQKCEASLEVLLFLLDEREDRYKQALKLREGRMDQKQRAVFRKDFKNAFSITMLKRVHEINQGLKAESVGSNALVIHANASSEEAAEFLKSKGTKTVKSKPRTYKDGAAVMGGRTAAETVEINKGLTK